MKTNSSFFALFLFSLTPTLLQGAVVVDQSHLSFTASTSGFGSGIERAQTFTVGVAGVLDSVQVHIFLPPVVAADLTYSISDTTFGVPDEISLLSGAVTGLGGGFAGMVTIDVSWAALSVSPGDQLAIVLGNSAAVADEEGWSWLMEADDTSDPYDGGTFFLRTDEELEEPEFETWAQNPVSSTEWDGVFQTFVNVPEPSLVSLLAYAAMAMTLRRKRCQ